MLNVAIIGAGAIARRGHLPALKILSDVNVVAIADINEETAKRVAKEFKIPHYYTNYREMLSHEKVDAVHICTPTPTHYEIAKYCIETGHHVLIEKPMCMRLKEAIELKELARENDVIVGVVYNYRYFPSVLRTLLRVKKGYLGNVISLNGTCFSHFPIAWTRSTWLYHEGGVLYDFFPHLVDLLLLFGGGKPQRILAFGGDYLADAGFVNHASLLVHLDNNVLITAHTSWITGTFMFYLWIHGTGGHIFLDVRYDSYRELHGMPNPIDDTLDFVKNMIKLTKNVLSGKFFVGALANYIYVIRDFIQTISTGQRQGLFASIDDEINRIFIIEGALQSIKKNGEIITWDDLLK